MFFIFLLSIIFIMLIVTQRNNSFAGRIITTSIIIMVTGTSLFADFTSTKLIEGKGIAILPLLNYVNLNSSIYQRSKLQSNEILSVFEKDNYFEQNKVLNTDSLDLTLSERVAWTYGINEFFKVKSISYTFNVINNGKELHRTWRWDPKTNIVTYWGKDKSGKNITITYNRKGKMDEKLKKIDAVFINDNYWLLFPFHLVWDNHIDIKDAGMKKFPIGKGEGNCLIVKYLGNYGYTPDDVFELYLMKNYTIHQWVYLQGGSTRNPRPATWQGNKKFGKIMISTLHYGPHKRFKLWFTNIKVQY